MIREGSDPRPGTRISIRTRIRPIPVKKKQISDIVPNTKIVMAEIIIFTLRLQCKKFYRMILYEDV